MWAEISKQGPVSKSKTPATVSAVYSPRDNPATARGFSAASGFSFRSNSRPARPPTYIASNAGIKACSFGFGGPKLGLGMRVRVPCHCHQFHSVMVLSRPIYHPSVSSWSTDSSIDLLASRPPIFSLQQSPLK